MVAVNLGCLYFITHVEAQVLLVVTNIAVAAQALIYGRIGFTCILGIVHVMWIPMFAWMATRLDSILADPQLATWLAVLLATNIVSLVIDSTDVIRFLRGERAPHYSGPGLRRPDKRSRVAKIARPSLLGKHRCKLRVRIHAHRGAIG